MVLGGDGLNQENIARESAIIMSEGRNEMEHSSLDPNERKAYVLENGEWVKVKGMDIKRGMSFKLFDPDGTPVGEKEYYIASADSYLTRDGIICTPCY